MRVHSEDKILKLKNLRKTGHSITELVNFFSIPKTTVWHHIQGVKVLPKYAELLKSKQGGSKNKAAKEWQEATQDARALIPSLNKHEKILIATSLYWAEGSKGDFTLSNSDPDLIRIFINCLKELGIGKDKLSINIRIYEDLNIDKVCNFWSRITGIPKREIKYVNILYGKKHGKLPYGMCRVRVKKPKYFLKLINALRQSIINEICPGSSTGRAAHS